MNRLLLLSCLCLLACQGAKQSPPSQTQELGSNLPEKPYRIILDTDANNELDDQHAIAYMLFQPEWFDVVGITVNDTENGGGIEGHVAEAERVVHLCDRTGDFPVLPGAKQSYATISPTLAQADHDGYQAVDFIIEQARASQDEKLILAPIGKLTNIALALSKAPDIAANVRIIWLGSNWPFPGEYNLRNDTTCLNPLLSVPNVPLEIATVRYGKPTGTAAVMASLTEIRANMPGLGPKVDSIAGRAGGFYTCFGDYSIALYEEIGDEQRSLFDVCVLSLLKNPAWAEAKQIPIPWYQNSAWTEASNLEGSITMWENFDRDGIVSDFYEVMQAVTKP